ncbi:MAG: Zn-dependent alcohol dehydrogenase [Acidimicrobiales bacterium]|nr:Zn-dependent alcohol dehydrogenase [Acidimicrobiales bacterium]HRW36716.1 Zn-dependent alcohol dehydrogenase [Aquihabitans sp.]
MRAAVLEEAGAPLVLRDDIDVEEPRAGEVAVRVAHCGVCHSDLSIADGKFPSALPVILGHEAAGIVEAVGPGVTTHRIGDHVVLTPCPPCGTCAWCIRGEWSLCVNSDSMMTSAHPDGGTRLRRGGEVVYRGVGVAAFAETVIIQANGAVTIPEDVPLDVACVIGCAVQTGVGAVLNTAQVREGDTVVVMGAGGIGLSIVQGARIAGAGRIVVSDPDEARRAAALGLGATDAIDPTVDDVVAVAHDLSPGGIGADVAFDAVGRSALIATGIDATRKGGTTVIVGVPAIDDPFTYALPAVMAIGEKKVVGSLLGSCNSLRDIPKLIALDRAGRLDLSALITARRPLAEINQALDDLRATVGIRTVLDV